ncbi:MAG: AraC family transcriptional regulator [Ruthenibacterium sp.]
MIQHINATETIDSASETHYQFRVQIDPTHYPQVHDFYELVLLTQGSILLKTGSNTQLLHSGSLVLIRPGDVHTKTAQGESHHINLAFPAKTVEALFAYLDEPARLMRLKTCGDVLCTRLTQGETLLLQTQMQQLNLLPISEPSRARSALRRLLLEVMVRYFWPLLEQNPPKAVYPYWLSELLTMLDDPGNLAGGMAFMTAQSGCTKEHVCRSFKKYFGVTPAAYLNARRLNYVANMLVHSDHEILDIAYEVGFQSIGWFYHVFKLEFGCSPLRYRVQNSESAQIENSAP